MFSFGGTLVNIETRIVTTKPAGTPKIPADIGSMPNHFSVIGASFGILKISSRSQG